jgi:hypothetical protein
MSRQLLIYQTAVPLSFANHGGISLEAATNFGFSAGINAVPLMAVELPQAAVEYAIVFTVTEQDVVPAVVLGIRNEQNLFLSSDAKWQAKYIPAFIRRYPFVFSTSADGKTLILCIDETHPGLNREGRGKKLFGADGKPSEFTEQVLTFLKEYQTQFERTRIFGRHLRELGLLEPMQAEVTTPSGEQLKLSGFHAVSREKIRALDADSLASLARTDELELIYLHLYSMRNFSNVKDRLLSSLVPAEAVTAE